MRNSYKNTAGFTLPEVLIAVSIFAMVSTIAAALYAQSFKETRRATTQNQLYEDARYVMGLIADEAKNGMIDYDEYYSQNVVGATNYGQSYGRYYSAFFNPGDDNKLGFDCNDGAVQENAFCGRASYVMGQVFNNNLQGICSGGIVDNASIQQAQHQTELYLISADAKTKTILALEKIGGGQTCGATGSPACKYALSLLRLTGSDTNNDIVPDTFVCADGFQCMGTDSAKDAAGTSLAMKSADCAGNALAAGLLPRPRAQSFNHISDVCDTAANTFSKDFVPVSPLRVTITKLDFYISPLDNPQYAFAEADQRTQPRVTIVLTVEPNPDYTSAADTFTPVTLVETISSRVLDPIPAPVRVAQ